MKWTEQCQRANRAGVPLVAISSPDPMATMKVLKDKVFKERPILVWDCLRGLSALNEQGKPYVNDMNGDPAAFLMEVAPGLPDGAVVFMLSADEYLDQTPTRQGIWNLRDSYKSSGRMLVMLGNSFKVPASLINDVVLIDEEYPDEESVKERIQEIDNEVSLAFRQSFYNLLAHLSEKLQPTADGSKKVLKQAAVDKVTDFLDTFSRRNVMNDTEMTKLVTQAKKVLKGKTAEGLKVAKEEIGGKLATIEKSLGSMIEETKRQFNFED